MEPFPPLPLEIARIILETAALSQPTALTLSLVSKTIYRWTKPILYDTIHISWSNLSRFLRGFFTRNIQLQRAPKSLIRSLLITECAGPGVINVVNRCEHLERLLCHSDIIECTTTKSRPRDIVISSSPDASIFYGECDEIPPVLDAVTHLFVQQRLLDDKFVETVASLEHLTHLGFFEFAEGATFVGGVKRLLGMEKLQSVLIMTETALRGALWAELAEIEDERLIVGKVEVVTQESMWLDTGSLKGWRKLVC